MNQNQNIGFLRFCSLQASWVLPACWGVAWSCVKLRGVAWSCVEPTVAVAWSCVELRGVAWSCVGVLGCTEFAQHSLLKKNRRTYSKIQKHTKTFENLQKSAQHPVNYIIGQNLNSSALCDTSKTQDSHVGPCCCAGLKWTAALCAMYFGYHSRVPLRCPYYDDMLDWVRGNPA